MSTEQLQPVIDTWNKLGRSAWTVTAAFYDRLFEGNPGLRSAFGATPSAQAERLTHMLSFAVTNANRPDTLLPAARQLGRLHAALGVRAEHYDAAEEPLLWALSRELGTGWTPTVEEAWRTFCAMTTTALKEGARMG